MPVMTGSVAFWFFPTVAGSGRKRFLVDITESGSPNRILYYVDSTGTLSAILMYDSTATLRVNQPLGMSGMVSGAWNYTEMNWDWNTGEINVYLNTARIWNTNIGTTYVRTDTTNRIQLDINKLSGSGLEDYVDDLCLFNAVLHTGNPISIPSAVYCALLSTRRLALGAPLGFANNWLGR
jgi:hypothetical protein